MKVSPETTLSQQEAEEGGALSIHITGLKKDSSQASECGSGATTLGFKAWLSYLENLRELNSLWFIFLIYKTDASSSYSTSFV